MKEYEFWYSESITYKAGFVARDLDHAKELLEKVFTSGEIYLEDLPEFWSKDKGSDFDYSPENLREY